MSHSVFFLILIDTFKIFGGSPESIFVFEIISWKGRNPKSWNCQVKYVFKFTKQWIKKNGELSRIIWANVSLQSLIIVSKQRLEKKEEEKKHTHNGDKLVMR